MTYAATATDIVSGAITPVCTPANGTLLPMGTTAGRVYRHRSQGQQHRQRDIHDHSHAALPVQRLLLPGQHGRSRHEFGLNLSVNSVNGGRNVPFKWEAFDNITGLELTDPARIEIRFVPYTEFLTQFSSLPGATSPLPNRNVCADAGRTIIPISGGTGKTTAVKFTNGQFNEGIQVPTRPAPSAWNCYVAWTRVIGDPSPGITSLFTLT